ncbi:MAG: DUF1361 domain-containing protein [Bacteroidota bacterium]
MSLKTSEETTLKIPSSATKLLLISACAMGALIYRIFASYQLFGFRFLIWNLILAWIPWIISHYLTKRQWPKPVLGIGIGLWILFLPNAPYLVTDLLHLRPDVGAPLWVELMMLFSFGFAGLIIGYSSVQIMENHLLQDVRERIRKWILAGLWYAVAYGVYIGRFLRKNSWDILKDPLQLLADIFAPFIDPFGNKKAILFTLVFGTILLVGYIVLRHRPEPASPSDA